MLKSLVEIVHSGEIANWRSRNEDALKALAGTRYSERAMERVSKLRAPEMFAEEGVPFAAYIHRDAPDRGPYGGLSFVLFPKDGHPCLVGLGVGTQGLEPDAEVLARPGHARKARAIALWLNREFGLGSTCAWAKHDPTRTDIDVPAEIKSAWSEYEDVFRTYGKVMYLVYRPTDDPAETERALGAILDLYFEERGVQPLATAKAASERLRAEWQAHLLPKVDQPEVEQLLAERKYVILQGPPGTGKTRMAEELKRAISRAIDNHSVSPQHDL